MSYSVCIPRAKYFVTTEMVKQVFSTIFGEDLIERVDRVERSDQNTGEGFWIIFVHFKDNEDTPSNSLAEFMSKLCVEGEVKVIYQDNWFWKVRQTTPKPPRKGPRIMTMEDEKEFKEFQKNFYKKKQEEEEEE